MLPRLLRAFRSTHPDVELHLQSMTTKEQLAALAERRLDLGLLRLPVGGARFSWRIVTREALVAALPKTHARATAKRVPLASLRRDPFVLYPRADGPAIRDTIISFCQRAGFSPTIVQESGEMQTILGLVAGGIGVALVIAPQGYRGLSDVVLKPLQDKQVPTWEMALTWRQDGELPPVVKAFLAVSEQVIRRSPNRP